MPVTFPSTFNLQPSAFSLFHPQHLHPSASETLQPWILLLHSMLTTPTAGSHCGLQKTRGAVLAVPGSPSTRT